MNTNTNTNTEAANMTNTNTNTMYIHYNGERFFLSADVGAGYGENERTKMCPVHLFLEEAHAGRKATTPVEHFEQALFAFYADLVDPTTAFRALCALNKYKLDQEQDHMWDCEETI